MIRLSIRMFGTRMFTVILMAPFVLTTMAVAAFAEDKTTLPATAACDRLRGWLQRYDFEKGSQHLSGRRFRSDVAMALCTAGRYEEGITILEKEARDAGYPFSAK